MAENLTLGQLNKAVKGTAAAFRCRRSLQPAGANIVQKLTQIIAQSQGYTGQKKGRAGQDGQPCAALIGEIRYSTGQA